MSRISYRKYQPGDEVAINKLYKEITGTERSVEEFNWQWLSSPAGKGEIWLLEYLDDEGNNKLIGHHGIMPMYFSFGAKVLIAGKTENTMVLPEFRRKFFYPKYEQIFLNSYINKFDILFSTIGPAAALRQRQALGYSSKEKWVFYDWSLTFGAVFAKITYSLSKRKNKSWYLKILKYFLEFVVAFIGLVSMRKYNSFPYLSVLSSQEAKQHEFFDNFWINSRSGYGITPRRFREDLIWRFWDNPYGGYLTFIFHEKTDKQAYAIIRKRSKTVYSIEDIALENPNEKSYGEIIETIGLWVVHNGGMVLRYTTTTDNHVGIIACNKANFVNLLNKYPFKSEAHFEKRMLRKVCVDRGMRVEQDVENWYITPFIFEGR